MALALDVTTSSGVPLVNHSEIESEYRGLLAEDPESCWEWERVPGRDLVIPTNLGAGRGRFWHAYRALRCSVASGMKVIDFGAYPGTLLRMLRHTYGREIELFGAGFAFSAGFRAAMESIAVPLLEMEFDARRPTAVSHGLNYAFGKATAGQCDIAVCTEVIEHLMYPLFLPVIMNRSLKHGGGLILTTNSACFIGDILKLFVGRHNVEEINCSHVLGDSSWRPHIRLFTLSELELVFQLAGYEIETSYYFDNYDKGTIYKAAKGIGLLLARRLFGLLPHLRSHIFIHAKKTSAPTPRALESIDHVLDAYGLSRHIEFPKQDFL